MTEPVLKLPLRVVELPPHWIIIDAEANSVVEIANPNFYTAKTSEQCEKEGAEIAKRCNAFEPMREALRKLLANWDAASSDVAIDMAREALALAEKGVL